MSEWQVETEKCDDGSYRWRHVPMGGGDAHSDGKHFPTTAAARAAGEAALATHHEKEAPAF